MTDLLQYINQIDQSVADAEINVLESLIQSYDKSIMIITEASDDTDLSSFDIFQEGERWDKFKEDTKAPVLGNKGESIMKKIIMILPRLIQKLIMLIKNFISKSNSQEKKMKKDLQTMKKIMDQADPVEEFSTDHIEHGNIVQEGLVRNPSMNKIINGITTRFSHVITYLQEFYKEQTVVLLTDDIDRFDNDLLQQYLNKGSKTGNKLLNSFNEITHNSENVSKKTSSMITSYVNDLTVECINKTLDLMSNSSISYKDRRILVHENYGKMTRIASDLSLLHIERLGFANKIYKFVRVLDHALDDYYRFFENNDFKKTLEDPDQIAKYKQYRPILINMNKIVNDLTQIANNSDKIHSVVGRCWNIIASFLTSGENNNEEEEKAHGETA